MFNMYGRLGRLAYFFTTLVCWMLLAMPGYYFFQAESLPSLFIPSILFWILGWVIMVWGFAWLWSATVRRLHDMDASGFWCILVYLFPISMLVLWIWPGTYGPNRYGLRM